MATLQTMQEIDVGKMMRPPTKVNLTQSELDICNRLGLKPEQYAAVKRDNNMMANTAMVNGEEVPNFKPLPRPEGHSSLCTCARCNTDIDCKTIAAEAKDHAEYEAEVVRQREALRLSGGNKFERASQFQGWVRALNGNALLANGMVEIGFYADLPEHFRATSLSIERDNMGRRELIHVRDKHNDLSVSHAVTDESVRCSVSKKSGVKRLNRYLKSFQPAAEPTTFRVAEGFVEDALYDSLANRYTQALADSMRDDLAKLTMTQNQPIIHHSALKGSPPEPRYVRWSAPSKIDEDWPKKKDIT